MINLTQILNTDSIGSLYLTLNGNSADIQAAINDIMGYVNVGTKKILVTDGTNVPTYSIELDGNNGKITANQLELTASNGLIVNGISNFGNTINAVGLTATGAATFNGGISSIGVSVTKSLNLATSLSANVFTSGYFVGGTGSYPIATNTYQTSNLFLDYSGCTASTNDRFSLGAGLQGQVVNITLTNLVGGSTSGFIDITGSGGTPLIAVVGSGTKISLNSINSVVSLRYDTNKWYLLNGNGFTIV